MNHFTDELTNDEYRNPDLGISTSDLKMFIEDPALLVWSKDAPRDETKLKAIDFGTDFHAYFLEPEKFKEQYKVLPEFNRRKKDEKQAELELIQQWENEGVIAVSNEDMQKLEAMRQSAMAHPTVKAIMGMDGVAECSFFWDDPDTGIKCKCRPDWLVKDISEYERLPFMPEGTDTLVVDVKSIANIDMIQSQSEKLKYHVQDAFYSQGIEVVTKGSVCFVFIYVSTSLQIGRHPVKCVQLAEAAKFDGKQEVNNALSSLKRMRPHSVDWLTTIEIDRPSWAVNNEDTF